MSEEKSVAAELKDILDVAVAQKADKADLEGVVKAADIEGMVKSEQLDEMKAAHAVELEAAKTEMREELEAKMAALPAVTEEVKSMDSIGFDFIEKTKDTGEVVKSLEIGMHKSVLDTGTGGTMTGTSFRGATDSQIGIIAILEQFNPWRAEATTFQTSGGSVKIPTTDIAGFSIEGSVPLLNARGTGGGSISSRTENVDNYTSWNSFSKPALEDINGVREIVLRLIVEKYANMQATVTLAKLKTAKEVVARGTDVMPGNIRSLVTSGLESYEIVLAEGAITTLSKMIDNCPVQYRAGSNFHVSPGFYQNILLSGRNDESGFAFDPASGQATVLGYPLVVNGHLEEPNDDTGDEVSEMIATFGNYSRALAYLERRTLSVEEFDNLNPGMVNYYGEARWACAIWDGNGLVTLNTAVA